jgi:hypothetical protein
MTDKTQDAQNANTVSVPSSGFIPLKQKPPVTLELAEKAWAVAAQLERLHERETQVVATD